MPTLEAVYTFFQNTPWLQALIVAAVAYGIAKIITHLLPKLLQSVANTLKLPATSTQLIELIPSPVFYVIFIQGLKIAVQVMLFSPEFEFAVIASLNSLMFVILASAFLRLSKLLLEQLAAMPNVIPLIQPQTLPLFNNLVVASVVLSTIYIIFSTWNVNMSALLASAGIVGLAVGMAARDTLSDIIAGVLILTDSPYRVGDIVILPDGTRGRITNIGIRSTCLQTIENFDVTVPNSTIGSSQLINESSNPSKARLVAADILLPYGSDMKLVREALLEVAQEDEHILEQPASSVRIIELERERLHCRLIAWMPANGNRFLIEFDINEAIYKKFAERQIPIFKPKENTLYVDQFPATAQEVHIKEIPSIFGKQNISSVLSNVSKLPASNPPVASKTTVNKSVSKEELIARAKSRTAQRLNQQTTQHTQTTPSKRPLTRKPPPQKPKPADLRDSPKISENGDDMMLDMDGSGD